MTGPQDPSPVVDRLRAAAAASDLDPDAVRLRIQALASGQPRQPGVPRGRRREWVTVLGAAAAVVAAVTVVTSGLGEWVGDRVTGVVSARQLSNADWDLAVKVRRADAGDARQLGEDAAESWVVPVPAAQDAQVHSDDPSWLVGPVQVMGAGEATAGGPFEVTWRGGVPVREGTGTQWLTAPQSARGVPSGLRVPVRLRPGTDEVTLLTGTTSGPGVLTATLWRADGSSRAVTVRWPGCEDPICPVVVQIGVRSRASVPEEASGDLVLDVAAQQPDGRIGLAAASVR